MNKTAYDMIKRHEGVRKFMYLDTKGIPTIGVGRNIRDRGLLDDEIELLFTNDLKDVEQSCKRICPTFYKLTEGRQAALMDMCMMGESKLSQFRKMLDAISVQDWKKASAECLSSKWAVDVGPIRSNDVASLILKG